MTSGLGSLFAGRAMRLGDPQRTMLSGTVLSILLICVTPFLGGIFALLFAAQAVARLAAGGRPADDVLGAGQGGRALPSGFGGRAAPDDEPAGGDRDPARYGRNRRPLGRRIELCDPRHRLAGTVRAGRVDHPPRHARSPQPARFRQSQSPQTEAR